MPLSIEQKETWHGRSTSWNNVLLRGNETTGKQVQWDDKAAMGRWQLRLTGGRVVRWATVRNEPLLASFTIRQTGDGSGLETEIVHLAGRWERGALMLKSVLKKEPCMTLYDVTRGALPDRIFDTNKWRRELFFHFWGSPRGTYISLLKMLNSAWKKQNVCTLSRQATSTVFQFQFRFTHIHTGTALLQR